MSGQRYLVTARKYRPQIFSELVAQEHVTETLKNAIRYDRLAHAYLFSGPRGVGKTTAARILAKAINCTTPLDDRADKAEPCRECDSCRTFEEGRSLNIIEIDAASNNRVDDIRDLRDTVRIPPQGGRKKVYIIDEVHMLTAQAFNALLKTLEEPPPHVLFIFATTEPHKVLPTILSRCQRFDFRRIAVPEIVARLGDICEEEDITADEASLMLIARKGDGALRDALSVFDQAVSLCGSNIQYPELAQALGVVDVDLYFEVSDKVIEQDAAGMLRLIERIVRSGHDLQEFLSGLAEHLRNLLVAHTMEDTSLIEAAEETRKRYSSAAEQFTEADLLRLLTLAEEAEERLKGSTQPRLKVETALLKMASITLAVDLREVIGKIERLETLAREGKLPTDLEGIGESSGASSPGNSSTPRQSASPPAKAESSRPKSASQQVEAVSQPSESASQPGQATTPPPKSAAQPTHAASRPAKAESQPPGPASQSPKAESQPPGPASQSPKSDRRPATSASQPTGSTTPPNPPQTDSAPAKNGPPAATETKSAAPPHPTGVFAKPALRRTAAEAAPANDGAADTAVAEASDAGPLDQIWTDVLERVKNDKIQVWSLLHHAKPDGYRDEQALIAVPNDFHRRILSSQESYVLEHVRPLADVPVRSLQFVIREEMEGAEAEETASEFDPYEYMQRKRQENPVIRAIFDQFGGELVW